MKKGYPTMETPRVLLIAGGGTLGSKTASELLQLGYRVDVVCLEDKVSENGNLTFIKARVDDAFLTDFFAKNRYDAIIDFIHYPDAAFYEHRYELLMQHTKHLIFLSSYRVYADEEHPIRETSPQLLDVSRDEDLLANEKYAIPKSKCERLIRNSKYRHWTIVRPLISFSNIRFDMVTTGASVLLSRARQHKKILLPVEAKNLVAGLGWSGNIGKMFARLVLNEKAYGEAFTLGSGEVHTWGEVAEYYTELIGAEFVWVDKDTFLENATLNTTRDWGLEFDRLFDRTIDNSKILRVTGLTPDDLVCVRDALVLELAAIPANHVFPPPGGPEAGQKVHEKMDAYLNSVRSV